jgi:hypothetical protein
MLLELTGSIPTTFSIPEKWAAMIFANEGKIQDLVEVYFEVIYPM